MIRCSLARAGAQCLAAPGGRSADRRLRRRPARRGRQRRLARHLERPEGRRAPAARDRAGRRRRLRSGGRGGRGCPRAGSGGRREVQSRAGRGLRPLRRLAGVPSPGARRVLAAIASDRSRAVDGPGHALPEWPAVGPGRALPAAQRQPPQRRADHALLGSLYDRLERPADAVRHWRLATAASMALPVLATDAALPAADTGSDPYRVDAEGGYAVASPTWTTRPARSPATRPCRPPRPSPTMCWIPTPASARNSTTARWRPKTRARRRHQRLRRVFRQRAAGGRFRGPGAHVRAGAARGCQARGRPAAPVPTPSRRSRTTASIDHFLRHSQG